MKKIKLNASAKSFCRMTLICVLFGIYFSNAVTVTLLKHNISEVFRISILLLTIILMDKPFIQYYNNKNKA